MKTNIFSRDWCNMVFENKNKDYGAYALRKGSDKRHLLAMIIGTLFFSAAVSMPTILKNILPKKTADPISGKLVFDDFNKNKEEKKAEKLIDPHIQEVVRKTIQFVIPKAVENTKEENDIITQADLAKTHIDIGIKTQEGDTMPINPDILDHPKNNLVEPDIIFNPTNIEEQPTFPGGIEKLYKYLNENIKYPDIELSNGIDGIVYVGFVVGKDGRIREVHSMRKVSPGLDEEAERVVKAMPAWLPGRQNGKAVSVNFSLPVKFVVAKQ